MKFPRLSLRCFLDNSAWGQLAAEVASWLIESGVQVVFDPLKMPTNASYFVRQRIGKPADDTPEILIGPPANTPNLLTVMTITSEPVPWELSRIGKLLIVGNNFQIGYSPDIFSPTSKAVDWPVTFGFCIGTSGHMKNSLLLMDAIKEAFRGCDDVRFATIGQGMGDHRCEETTHQMVTHELAEWYQKLTCYIGTDPNGMGFAELQAMASGAMVIMPDEKKALPGSPIQRVRWEKDDLVGLLRSVWIDQNGVRQARAKCVEWARGNTWEKSKEQFFKALEAVS